MKYGTPGKIGFISILKNMSMIYDKRNLLKKIIVLI